MLLCESRQNCARGSGLRRNLLQTLDRRHFSRNGSRALAIQRTNKAETRSSSYSATILFANLGQISPASDARHRPLAPPVFLFQRRCWSMRNCQGHRSVNTNDCTLAPTQAGATPPPCLWLVRDLATYDRCRCSAGACHMAARIPACYERHVGLNKPTRTARH